MEHKWGRNVYHYGVSDLGITLCSRLLGFGPTFVLTNKPALGNVCVYIQTVLDTASPLPYVVGVLPKFAPHFPYGWPVEPDVPL